MRRLLLQSQITPLLALFSTLLCGIAGTVLLGSTTSSSSVIPEMHGPGPIGIIVDGPYTKFQSRSLLGISASIETPPQRLVRQYAQLTASRNIKGLLELYRVKDGSRDRLRTLIEESESLKSGFVLTSAELVEELEWGSLSTLMVALKGGKTAKPAIQPLLAVCPNDVECSLVFPQFGPESPELETLDTVFNLFSKHSILATSDQLAAFAARQPLVIPLHPGAQYVSASRNAIHVRLIVDRYAIEAPTRVSSRSGASHEEPPEVKAFFSFRDRLRSLKEEEINEQDLGFRRFITDELHADYAVDLQYTTNYLKDDKYQTQLVSSADFARLVRSWESAEPACVIHHGDTAYMYIRTHRVNEPPTIHMIPARLIDGNADFEALRFATYSANLLQTPEIITELSRFCGSTR